jgi:hypothetical protein
MLRNERGQGTAIIVSCVIGLVIIIAFVFNWLQTRPQEKISVLGIFGEKELSPGQSTDLTVQIKNLSDKSIAYNVYVTIAPLDPLVIHVVSGNPIVIGTLGPGEERSPEFSIFIIENAMKGTYTIKASISVEYPLQGDNKESTITVV